MITRLSFLECFSKHGYFTMHRLVWSKELLNYIAPFICHFGKTERECIVVVIAHPMEVTVLQKVKPDIGFFEVACWRWYISSKVLKIWGLWSCRAENSVVNLDNCPQLICILQKFAENIYVYMYCACLKILGHNYLLSNVYANVP